MYNIIYEMSRQSRFDARYWMLGAGALGWPRGMVWGGRREEGSGWGTHVYLWRIHVDIWQNQYNIVKLKKKKFKNKNYLSLQKKAFVFLILQVYNNVERKSIGLTKGRKQKEKCWIFLEPVTKSITKRNWKTYKRMDCHKTWGWCNACLIWG